MKVKRLRNILLGAALLTPVLLSGQEPTQNSASEAQMQAQPQNQPQMQNQTTPSSPRSSAQNSAMQDSSATSGDVGQTMKDKIFLRKAAAGGLAEVKLGQLAAQKATSDDVKQFGQKMVDDHTKLNSDMAPIADSMGVRLPQSMNKQDQAEYDKLNGLSGNDFDMEYLSFMVKDHHQDLREFRNEAAATQDPTLREAVDKGEKVIHEHMVMVDKLARDKGVPMPERHSHPTQPPTM